MEMVMSLVAVVIATIALFVALMTHAQVSREKDAGRQSCKSSLCIQPQPKAAEPKTAVSLEQERAVLRKEIDNFIHYDGFEQDPINPNTILADSGE